MKIQTPDDFSFAETTSAHGWRGLAPFAWNDEESSLEYIHQYPSGRTSSIRISEINGEVIVDSNADPEETMAVVRRMLQLDLPMGDFHKYCSGHEKFAHVPRLKQGRMLVSPTVFEDVVKVICTTNTTWAQTKSMVARIADAYGAPDPLEPSRKAFPTPEQILSDNLEEFSAKAKLGYRNASVYKIASDIAAGILDLEELRSPEITTADLNKRLLTLPGVGPYAASCLMIYLGRYERVNVDSWARTLVGKELGRSVMDKEVHAFFEEFGEWRALVYHFYPWREDA